jgi:hypothetical protein
VNEQQSTEKLRNAMRISAKKTAELTSSLNDMRREAEDLKSQAAAAQELRVKMVEAEKALAAASVARAAAEATLEQATSKAVPVVQVSHAAPPSAEEAQVHAVAASTEPQVCRSFAKGTCKYGAQCRYKHELPAALPSAVEHPPTDTAPAPEAEAAESRKRKEPEAASVSVEEEGGGDANAKDREMNDMRNRLLEKRRKLLPKPVEAVAESPVPPTSTASSALVVAPESTGAASAAEMPDVAVATADAVQDSGTLVVCVPPILAVSELSN